MAQSPYLFSFFPSSLLLLSPIFYCGLVYTVETRLKCQRSAIRWIIHLYLNCDVRSLCSPSSMFYIRRRRGKGNSWLYDQIQDGYLPPKCNYILPTKYHKYISPIFYLQNLELNLQISNIFKSKWVTLVGFSFFLNLFFCFFGQFTDQLIIKLLKQRGNLLKFF